MSNSHSSTIASKINTIFSYIWAIATAVFFYVLLASTSFFTKDPCYGKGCSENSYLVPMLTSLFLGIAFFSLTILTGVFRILRKSEKWKAPLGLTSVKISALTLIMTMLFVVYFLGSARGSFVAWGKGYTGEELLGAVNLHRKSVGLTEVKLGEGLCDNLVSRWKAVKDGNQHSGFEEWVADEGIQTNYGYGEIAELYIQAPTPFAAVAFWAGSPGHKIQLENPKWTEGCAYANENTGVVMLSTKEID